MLRLEEIISLEVLSSDAKVIGTVEGVGVDTEDWRVGALKVAVAKGVEASLGIKKPMFGLARTAFPAEKVDSVRDVVKMKEPMSRLPQFVIDPSLIPVSAGDLINKRVVSNNGRELGLTESLYLDPEGNWKIPYLELELDKEAFRDMKLRKGTFKKRDVKVPTNLIGTVGDLVMLNTTEEELARILQHTQR